MRRPTTARNAARQPDERLVRVLSLAILLQWSGASAILPLLPIYLRQRGGSDALVGTVMAGYFAAAVISQYPAGRLADRIGRLPVLLAGLALYALGSVLFLVPVGPVADVVLRALQGAGAGAAEVAALAMVSHAVPLARRGRAFGSIYGAQLGGMAVGPLFGSLAGVGAMDALFLAAGVAALVACVPVVLGAPAEVRGGPTTVDGTRHSLDRGRGDLSARGLPQLGRPLVGAALAAAAIGLTTGVYESCWTLLLDLRGAADWEIGLSWTLFAVPFVAMSRPGGWLADHLDRRWLVVVALAWSAAFCAAYPFLHQVALLLVLGSVESVGFAVALPSAQSLLTQSSMPAELGRVQGMYATSQTGATAAAAACAGALFGVAPWVPFVSSAAFSMALLGSVAIVWAPVAGRVTQLGVVTGASGVLPGPAQGRRASRRR
jgi:DHA1 family multidrug resistance protein-like MFS transporter